MSDSSLRPVERLHQDPVGGWYRPRERELWTCWTARRWIKGLQTGLWRTGRACLGFMMMTVCARGEGVLSGWLTDQLGWLDLCQTIRPAGQLSCEGASYHEWVVYLTNCTWLIVWRMVGRLPESLLHCLSERVSWVKWTDASLDFSPSDFFCQKRTNHEKNLSFSSLLSFCRCLLNKLMEIMQSCRLEIAFGCFALDFLC